ncbi:hypothetical protein DA075_30740 [Methylobacterium currus]|uniref:Uncharacterized protein n=1 Tax=Methylobacterium currus TaxID=2051553 RepID=A0A2R4WUS8_9HYPH|nr:hypothetical protein [Methylobacterium currus]AWB25303.1 hypothetical protein DA075_30740 [Methylobacterium currus]
MPSRRSFLRAGIWNTPFTGIADAEGLPVLQAAAGADLPTDVQILIAAGAGGEAGTGRCGSRL